MLATTTTGSGAATNTTVSAEVQKDALVEIAAATTVENPSVAAAEAVGVSKSPSTSATATTDQVDDVDEAAMVCGSSGAVGAADELPESKVDENTDETKFNTFSFWYAFLPCPL